MKRKILFGLAAFLMGAALNAQVMLAEGMKDDKPFGGPGSVQYAGKLWQALVDAGMVGENALRAKPYKGIEPHGAILENFERDVTVGGHTGVAVVKKNYVGDGITVEQVVNDAAEESLASVTVMYRREAGYDADNDDWFWVKYSPDGGVLKNPKGASLAGRVAKGMNAGCIACHKGAPGGDYVYTHDKWAN